MVCSLFDTVKCIKCATIDRMRWYYVYEWYVLAIYYTQSHRVVSLTLAHFKYSINIYSKRVNYIGIEYSQASVLLTDKRRIQAIPMSDHISCMQPLNFRHSSETNSNIHTVQLTKSRLWCSCGSQCVLCFFCTCMRLILSRMYKTWLGWCEHVLFCHFNLRVNGTHSNFCI